MSAKKILQRSFGSVPEHEKKSENATAATLPLAEMLDHLSMLTDAQWGQYAFSREPIRQKFTISERLRLAKQAEECGRSFAKNLQAKEGSLSMNELAARMSVTVEHQPIPSDGSRVLFAQFFPPAKIRIYDDCLDKAEQFLPIGESIQLTRRKEIADMLLAHELFHRVEEQNQRSILTRQERVRLWAIGPIKYHSPISCLSEIAAMAFAKELCGLSFSPYLLDVFLVYGYNPTAATNLYNGIVRIAGTTNTYLNQTEF